MDLTDIIGILGAVSPIIVALIERKSSKKDKEEIEKLPFSPETQLFAFCFIIYAVCGFVSAALSGVSNLYSIQNINIINNTGLWLGVNVTWLIGNAVIVFKLHRHFFKS